jgi:hypothetical protein
LPLPYWSSSDVGRLRLNLLPQLPHIDSKVLGIRQVVPQFPKKKLVGEHLASMLHKHAREVMLFGGKLHLLVVHFDNASHKING